MITVSKGQIRDIGNYALTLSTCLDNEQDLTVPANLLKAYEETRKKFQLALVAKLPPPVQALILEEARLNKEFWEFPPEGRVVDKELLSLRMRTVNSLHSLLVREILANRNIRIMGPHKGISFLIGPDWNIYIPLV